MTMINTYNVFLTGSGFLQIRVVIESCPFSKEVAITGIIKTFPLLIHANF